MKTQKKLALVGAFMALALIAAACGGGAGSSPTATAKAFYDAAKGQDVAGIKKTMSKGSLELMEKAAKASNRNLDDVLKQSSSTMPEASFESRNEKITGDTATLEVTDGKGKWETIPLVKEDGQWKIAFDKSLQQTP